MNINHRFCVFFSIAVAIFFSACKDNNQNLGSSIKPQKDSIIVALDTFHLQSSNFFVDSIFLENDTFLLGEIYNSTYGTTKADLLFQVAPPLNYIFPTVDSDSIKDASPDSLVMFVYYKTWFGSETSPFELSLYEMDKKTLNYSDTYYSNIDALEYTSGDESVLIGKKVMTSVNQTLNDSILSDSTYTPSIRYTLKKEYAEKFFQFPKNAFTSEAKFLEYFKGFYLTTTFGSSTMLYIKQIDLRLFYHYTRNYKIDGKDYSEKVSTWVNFPANKEVRQVNGIKHPDRSPVKTKLNAIDSVNHIKSPAGIYTNVRIPLKRMAEKIERNVNGKLLTINSANLTLEIIDSEATSLKMKLPYPEYLLLVKKDKLTSYFMDKSLPTSGDTTAVIGYYDSASKSYTFDMSYFITKHLRDSTLFPEWLDMVILPIGAGMTTSSSSTYITSIYEMYRMGGVAIRSSKNKKSPMRIEVLYSGF